MIPLVFPRLAPDLLRAQADEFHRAMTTRRTVRHFSSEPVPFHLVETAIATAASAPSGANQQPWRFVVVQDPEIKRQIREAAEAEERQNYEHRFPDEWLQALAALGTDWHKEFLEIVPALIVVFAITHEKEGEKKHKNYYVSESVGIAVGFLLSAIHNAGLVSLTHTPSPMGFLQTILGRPDNERPYLLIPVGYPNEGATVPNISRKTLGEIMQWNLG